MSANLRRVSRRTFLKTTGAGGVGLTLWFAIPWGQELARAAEKFEPNVLLTITPDGTITVHITKAEMGQGIGTAMAQVVAEELEADWKDIRIDYPINDPKYGPMGTGGSRSVSTTFDALSRAGAAARIMLIDAVAKHWKVLSEDCVAERGVVRHPPSARAISYGEIVARVPITRTLTPDDLKKIQLKKPNDYKLIGKWIPRLDIPEKTTGQAKFGIDVFLPGMVYAKVAYPPTREGGKHQAVDDSAARQVKGYVKTVVAEDLVAVVAETYEAAVKARDALKITWDPGPYARVSTAWILHDYERKAQQEAGVPWVTAGDVKAGMAQATHVHAATYLTDFVVHAQLEPMNCVARFEGGVLELFTGTQLQTFVTGLLAKRLGLEPAKIRIHQQYLGGGFGRRLEGDIVVEAGIIAKEAGRPIKLIRSREEDFRRGYYRSFSLQNLKAGLDASGRVTAWEHTVVVAYPRARRGGLDKLGRDPFSLNGADHVYDVPNQLVRAIQGETGISVGYWRAVAPGYTFFAVETFLDELAHRARIDPLQYRLGMLKSQPRLARVLELAARRAGWGTPLPPGVGRGIACATAQERQQPTYTAAVVQARVDARSGAVRVEKMTCAVDVGIVVSPDGVRSQVEGGLIFGLSAALKERGTVSNGAFDQSNFHDYQILRMDETPEVEVYVVESTEPPTGIGEPGVTVVAPALSNAIFSATGARVRSVPFLPERVLKAVQERT